MRAITVMGLLAAVWAVQPVWADEGEGVNMPAGPVSESAVQLETLVVSGVMRGPGLWKVHHGEHVMWVLGTIRPVSRRMQWDSGEVEALLAGADKVLLGPSVKLDLGRGRLRTLMLVPSIMRARRNPDGEKLVDQVSAEDYARWLVLKKKYLGRDAGVEKRRPLFAAQELFAEAVRDSGLRFESVVTPVLDRQIKRHKLKVERPRLTVEIDDPRQAIKQFRSSQIDDVECFSQTMLHLEADLEKLRQRANAWAVGDVAALRELTDEGRLQACMDAVLQSGFARERGIDDLNQRVEALWLEAAEKILAEHKSSFAVLPIGRILEPDGYLAKLAARGYRIEAPQEQLDP